MREIDESISEKEFEQQVHDLARLLGYKYYHTYRSKFSEAGFPDCTLVRENDDGTARLLIFELKAEKGKVSAAQQGWLDLLGKVQGVGVYLFRPSDWPEIVEILQRKEARK